MSGKNEMSDKNAWAKGYAAAKEALRGELEWQRAEIERQRTALEDIALLDEAGGYELTIDHALRSVDIATRALGKNPSEIFANRFRQSERRAG